MRVFAIVSLLLLVPAQSAWAQSSERTAYVSVLDKKEAPATGLTASDFIVREDDIAREVLRASHATQPAQIALLIDTSQAIEEQITDIRTALRDFVKQMAGKHEISLVGFGERPMMIVDYTRDVARLEKGIGTIFAKSGSGTYILDAIVDEARKLQKRKAVRPHLIVYAARGPEFSERHSQGVVDVLRETGVTFHALPLNRPGIGVRDREEQELQMTLANGTQHDRGTPGRPAYPDELLAEAAVARRRNRQSVRGRICATTKADTAEDPRDLRQAAGAHRQSAALAITNANTATTAPAMASAA